MSMMTSRPNRTALWVLAVLLLSRAALGQELLENPGFEAASEDGLPTAWQRYGGVNEFTGLAVVGEAHSGQRAVRLTDTGPCERNNQYATGVVQTVPVTAGCFYKASVWAKTKARNRDDALNMQLRFLPGETLRQVKLDDDIDGEWHKSSLAARAPEGTTHARLYIFTQHYWTVEAVIDDASLEALEAETGGLEFVLLTHGSTGIDTARKLNLTTPIVLDGTPKSRILLPEGPTYDALGRKLVSAIQAKSGASIPVTTRYEGTVDSAETIIALGNLNNNRMIERLYFNKYLAIDSLKPGPGEYVLQTVHEPYNGPLGKNVIVIGASDDGGLSAGVDAFVASLGDGPDVILTEPLLVVSSHEPLAESAREQLLSGDIGQHALKEFWAAAQQYRDTGDLAWAERAKRILLHCGGRLVEDPDYHVTWPEETSSHMIGAMWDVLEEAPVFTDRERVGCQNILLATLHDLPRYVSGYTGLEQNDTIIWNHTTFPLMGIYWLSRYFDRYYGDVDGRMELMLKKVAAAFEGQVTSWKPQEDSLGYYSIVPRHTIEYTLAENDYRYFENGSVRRHADYTIAICDNTGDAAGFGDSGYGRSPYVHNIHWALWYYKDGRYLWWLNEVLPNGYLNPYDRTVPEREWPEIQGVNVFELHPQVYGFTKARSYYGGPLSPPNVPIEKAFDKISFRENLDPDGEYMLLDGYARGKHLQYDGNAIIKFYADGQDWLIDGDYLVRNTTDHNMISIIKDGRCAELLPTCTALEAKADLPTVGMTRTMVADYNGANWYRNIFWFKGECTLVVDELEAVGPGQYTFLGNWKTLAVGDQGLHEGRIFKTSRRGSGHVGSRDLVTIPEPAPGVQKAVKFNVTSSQLDTTVRLPAGRYELVLYAKGVDTGADSFFVTVDDAPPIAFHIPIESFGRSSSSWTKDTPSPNITVERDGPHRLSITLRENPGPMLDRFVIKDGEGSVLVDMEAEDAPPVPEDRQKQAPSKDFYVKNDGFAANRLADRVNHVGRKITYLRQRFGGTLAAGEKTVLANIFYNDSSDAPKHYDLRRVTSGSFLILKDGLPFTVCNTGREAAEQWAGLTSWQGSAKATLERAAKSAMPPIEHARRPAVERDGMTLLWSTEVPLGKGQSARPILALLPIDLDGDNNQEILALRGRTAICLDARGQTRWTFDTGGLTRAVSAYDLDADGRTEILLGSDDEHVYVLDCEGREQKRHHANIPLRVGRSSVREPKVGNIVAGDLDNNGEVDLIVGLLNGNLLRYDLSFVLEWRYDDIPHGSREIDLVDLDRDGVLEILVANRYGSVQIFAADGNPRRGVYSELGDVEMACGNLDEDEALEIANGSSTGVFVCQEFGGPVEFQFPNYGFGVREVIVADMTGDARDELLLASETGYVYVLDGNGNVLAQHDFGAVVSDAAILEMTPPAKPVVAVCCEDGQIAIIDGQANVKAEYAAGAKAVLVDQLRTPHGSHVLAATEERVLCLGF